jgi:hypothetical protein
MAKSPGPGFDGSSRTGNIRSLPSTASPAPVVAALLHPSRFVPSHSNISPSVVIVIVDPSERRLLVVREGEKDTVERSALKGRPPPTPTAPEAATSSSLPPPPPRASSSAPFFTAMVAP